MKIRVLASSSKGNSYWISDGKTQLLLDAGIPFKAIQSKLDFKVSEIAGVLITHRHKDHALAIADMLKRGIKVYGNTDLNAYNNGVRVIPTNVTIGIGTFDITAHNMKHDVECYAYEIYSYVTDERLVYVTDTADILSDFRNINYMLVEANYDEKILKSNVFKGVVEAKLAERIINTHLSIDNLLEWFIKQDKSNLKEVYLLHLSDKNSDEKSFHALVKSLTNADVYCKAGG